MVFHPVLLQPPAPSSLQLSLRIHSHFLLPGESCLSDSLSVRGAWGSERAFRRKPGPFTFLVKGSGILEWQIKGFMARTAALNSGVMKASGSITHLFVFLLRWITVSMADSLLEWNENKTIIQRMRVCRKGKKSCDFFQEFISLMGHVHLRQEKSSRLCPWDPHYPFAFVPQRHLSLDKVPWKTQVWGGSGCCWRHRNLGFLSPPAIARARSLWTPWPGAESCPLVWPNSQPSMEPWQPPGRMNTEPPSAGEDVCDTYPRKDFMPGSWRHCVYIAPAAFCLEVLQGRERTCKGLTTVRSIPASTSKLV